MPVRPDDMLVFAAVVRAGSFSAAATALGLTKQRVSARVARLEDALQVRLLERTTRRLRPTDAGAAYFERCDAIARQIEDAHDIARQRQRDPVGRLHVASPTLYGRRFLAPVIARYTRRHPRVQVVLTLTNRPIDLIADGIDLAIQVGRLKDSSHTVRRLGDGYLYVVASPAYLHQYGTPTVSTLSTARCVGLRTREEWPIDDHRVAVTPVVAANDLETLCDLAIDGVGIALLPGLVCQDAVRDGRLVRLFPEARVPVRPISAVYPSRRTLAVRVARFLDLLTTDVLPMTPL